MKKTNLMVVGVLAALILAPSAFAAARGGGGRIWGGYSGASRSFYGSSFCGSRGGFRSPGYRSYTLPSSSGTRSHGSSFSSRSYGLPSWSGSRSHVSSPAFRSYSAPAFRSTTPSSAGTRYIRGQTYTTTGLPKVNRSEAAKSQFLRQHGYTSVPAGYQVDHRVPLFRGGSDTPSNMQLLPSAVHQAKTAAERAVTR